MPTEYTRAEFATVELWSEYLESLWGTRPTLVFACAGGSDAHWQAWRSPARSETPDAVLV